MTIAERIIHLHRLGEAIPLDLMAHAEMEGHNLDHLESIAMQRDEDDVAFSGHDLDFLLA